MTKGQINIEFLASAGLFIITVVTLITTNQLPGYTGEMNQMSQNLEAKTLTDQLITEEGRHSYGNGGKNWEKNSSTIENADSIGFANEHYILDREKINNLKTATVSGSTGVNYTQFLEITDVENQYRFTFVWLPTVQTNNSYIRGNTPSNPDITEPETTSYSTADNSIHYGSVELRSTEYMFLVAAHDGIYDSVYVEEESWDFSDSTPSEPYSTGDRAPENNFYIEQIQNRAEEPGSLIILRKQVKQFGPSVNTDTEVSTFDRMAVLENEPLRLEVAVW